MLLIFNFFSIIVIATVTNIRLFIIDLASTYYIIHYLCFSQKKTVCLIIILLKNDINLFISQTSIHLFIIVE